MNECIRNLKEVTERDRAKGTKADTFYKVICTFYSIIVLIFWFHDLVYRLYLAAQFTTLALTLTLPSMLLLFIQFYILLYRFSETIFMFVFFSAWVGNSNSNGHALNARSSPTSLHIDHIHTLELIAIFVIRSEFSPRLLLQTLRLPLLEPPLLGIFLMQA